MKKPEPRLVTVDTMVRFHLRTVSTAELTKTRKELEQRLQRINTEMQRRCDDGVKRYGCSVCGLIHSTVEVVYSHVRKVHRYPSEDAASVIKEVYD